MWQYKAQNSENTQLECQDFVAILKPRTYSPVLYFLSCTCHVWWTYYSRVQKSNMIFCRENTNSEQIVHLTFSSHDVMRTLGELFALLLYSPCSICPGCLLWVDDVKLITQMPGSPIDKPQAHLSAADSSATMCSALCIVHCALCTVQSGGKSATIYRFSKCCLFWQSAHDRITTCVIITYIQLSPKICHLKIIVTQVSKHHNYQLPTNDKPK